MNCTYFGKIELNALNFQGDLSGEHNGLGSAYRVIKQLKYSKDVRI